MSNQLDPTHLLLPWGARSLVDKVESLPQKVMFSSVLQLLAQVDFCVKRDLDEDWGIATCTGCTHVLHS